MTRNALRGFAFGMILTTILFSALYYIKPGLQQKNENENPRPITEGEVQQYANAHQQVLLSKEEYETLLALKDRISNQKEETTTNNNGTSTNDNNTNTENSGVNPTDEETKIKEKQDAEDESESPTQNQKQAYSYILTVEKGMNSIQITKILEENQIIENAKDLESYLVKNNLNRSIQVGTYKLNSKMEFEEIGELLTQ